MLWKSSFGVAAVDPFRHFLTCMLALLSTHRLASVVPFTSTLDSEAPSQLAHGVEGQVEHRFVRNAATPAHPNSHGSGRVYMRCSMSFLLDKGVYTQVYIYVYICIHICIYVYIHIFLYVHMYMCVDVRVDFSRTCVNEYHIYMYKYSDIYICRFKTFLLHTHATRCGCSHGAYS